MEILERAKGESGELISFAASKKEVKEEADRRAAKLGYCTKYGESPYATKIQTTVPFGKERLNVWPRDKNGNLIGD